MCPDAPPGNVTTRIRSPANGSARRGKSTKRSVKIKPSNGKNPDTVISIDGNAVYRNNVAEEQSQSRKNGNNGFLPSVNA